MTEKPQMRGEWLFRLIHANVITTLQMVFSAVGLWYWLEGANVLGGFIFAGAALFDLVDGWWARKRQDLKLGDNRALGAWYDAFADKDIIFGFTAVATYMSFVYTQMPWWLYVLLSFMWMHCAIELVSVFVRTVNFIAVWRGLREKSGKRVKLEAVDVGKYKATFQAIGCCFFFLVVHTGGSSAFWSVIPFTCWAIAAWPAWKSLVQKIPKFRRSVEYIGSELSG